MVAKYFIFFLLHRMFIYFFDFLLWRIVAIFSSVFFFSLVFNFEVAFCRYFSSVLFFIFFTSIRFGSFTSDNKYHIFDSLRNKTLFFKDYSTIPGIVYLCFSFFYCLVEQDLIMFFLYRIICKNMLFFFR